MAEHVTEAAQIYWDNLDVLEEARAEFTAFFDDVYDKCRELVEAGWNDGQSSADVKSLEYWTERNPPGRWFISLPSKPLVAVGLTVSDPRRSSDRRSLCVALSTNDTSKRRMLKVAPDGTDVLREMARDAGISLSWDDNRRLSEEHISVAKDSASDTAYALAEVINERTALLARMEEWLRERVRTGETPID